MDAEPFYWKALYEQINQFPASQPKDWLVTAVSFADFLMEWSCGQPTLSPPRRCSREGLEMLQAALRDPPTEALQPADHVDPAGKYAAEARGAAG